MGKLFQDSGSTPQQRNDEARRLLEMIGGNDEREEFTDRDREFLRSLREKFDSYGSATQVSPKMIWYLRDLKDRTL